MRGGDNNVGSSYVDDSAEGSNGIGSVYGLAATSSILHNCASNHDDILGRVGELLDDKVDHLSEAGIFVLEEFGDSEEESGCFSGREGFASVEEQGDLG